MKFWQKPAGSVPKFHFGTPSNTSEHRPNCKLIVDKYNTDMILGYQI
ncbi:MAG: hypothetical protein GY795_44000 [Desulfobacterales bacterium]|nr:hypothetical protein [Desulfobacterales bacterium]